MKIENFFVLVIISSVWCFFVIDLRILEVDVGKFFGRVCEKLVMFMEWI